MHCISCWSPLFKANKCQTIENDFRRHKKYDFIGILIIVVHVDLEPIYTFSEAFYLGQKQCDYIWPILKVFVTKVAHTLSDVLGYFENHLFFSKNGYGYFLVNFELFLFYHLVTLARRPDRLPSVLIG